MADCLTVDYQLLGWQWPCLGGRCGPLVTGLAMTFSRWQIIIGMDHQLLDWQWSVSRWQIVKHKLLNWWTSDHLCQDGRLTTMKAISYWWWSLSRWQIVLDVNHWLLDWHWSVSRWQMVKDKLLNRWTSGPLCLDGSVHTMKTLGYWWWLLSRRKMNLAI